jgi:hypothetical protein
VRLLGLVAGQGAVNVLHATKPGALVVNQALTNTVGAAIKSAWTSNIGALQHPTSSLVRVGLRDLTQANQPEFLDSGAAIVGTGTGDALPGQTACCITLKTALSGKSFRGRVYIGGFTETSNDPSGLIATSTVNAILGFVVAISQSLSTSTLAMAIASRPSLAYVITKTWTLANGQTQVDTIGRGNARSGTAQAVTVIQNRNASWETQRRRVNGRGGVPTVQAGFAQRDLDLTAA